MSELIYLSNVRLSFPHIAEPQRQKNDDGTEKTSYNCEFIMPPNDPAFAKVMEVVGKMALEKWGQHASAVLNMVNQDRKKRGYGNGAEKINGKTFQPYDGYTGNVFVTAGSKNMPQIIDAQGNVVPPENTMQAQALARKMYGGCRVNAAVKPWLQDNKHGRGVRFDLVAVQFFADDTPFGEGHADVTGMFGAAPQAAAPQAPGFGPAPGAAPAMPGVPFPGAQAPAAPAWAPPVVPGAPAGLPGFLS